MNDKTTRYLFLSNLALISVGLLLIVIRMDFLPELIPLFFSQPWGKDQLAPKNYIFLISGTSLAIMMFNFTAGKLLSKKGEETLALIVYSASFLFSLLGVFALYKIIFLIT